MKETKEKQRRVSFRKGGSRGFRPFESCMLLAKGICAATGLTQSNLFALIVQAGLNALTEKKPGSIPLPLKFKIDDEVPVSSPT